MQGDVSGQGIWRKRGLLGDKWKEIQIEPQAQTRKQSKKMQGDVSGQGIWRKEAYWETNGKKST